MKEIWKDVKGFNGLYQVSNKGRVRSWNKSEENNGKPKIKSIYPNHDGYMKSTMYNKAKSEIKTIFVHRMVAEAFIPNPDKKPFIDHIDNDRRNNFVENLRWCTHQENVSYTVSENRHAKGEKVSQKLTKEDVTDIIVEYHTTEIQQKDLAEKYNVVPSTIRRIVKNKSWKHISTPKIVKNTEPFRKGIFAGENNSACKLTKNEVLDIRNAYMLGCFTQKEISEAYGVARGHVSNIVNNKIWVDV